MTTTSFDVLEMLNVLLEIFYFIITHKLYKMQIASIYFSAFVAMNMLRPAS